MPARKAQSAAAWRLAFEDEQIDLSERARVELSRGRPKSTLAVRFDTQEIDRLLARAESEGIGVTQLVRRWALERVDEPEDEGEMDSLLEALDQSLKAARSLRRTRRRRAG